MKSFKEYLIEANKQYAIVKKEFGMLWGVTGTQGGVVTFSPEIQKDKWVITSDKDELNRLLNIANDKGRKKTYSLKEI